jgi:hypothetical protein
VLADEIHDAPTTIALLNVLERKRRHLGPPQPTAQKHHEDGAVAKPRFRRSIPSVQRRLPN